MPLSPPIPPIPLTYEGVGYVLLLLLPEEGTAAAAAVAAVSGVAAPAVKEVGPLLLLPQGRSGG